MKNLLIGLFAVMSFSAFGFQVNINDFAKCSSASDISIPEKYQGIYASVGSGNRLIVIGSNGLETVDTPFFTPGDDYEIFSDMCVEQKLRGKTLIVKLKTSERIFWEGGLVQSIKIKLGEEVSQISQKRNLSVGLLKSGVGIKGPYSRFFDLKKFSKK